MYRKHPNHTYGRNRNDSANNWAIIAGNIMLKDYVEISTYFFGKSLTEKRTRRLTLTVLR